MTTFNTRVTFDHIRNTAAGFTAANPVLGYGVTGLETDTGKIKVGDGVAAWAALPYSGGGPVEWANVQGKPSTFAPSAHQHPISDVNGLQTALDAKASTTDARLSDAREWSAATVTQAEAEAGTSTSRLAFSPLRVFQAIAAWWAASAAKTKLDGIATGATANATDAQLRDRSTHTGTQPASTISDFSAAVVAAAPPTTDASLLTSGTLADARLTANVVLTGDSRLSNARTPTSHASSHQTGGSDAIAPVIVTPSSLSASQNDYAPGVCDILRLSSSTAIDLTGLGDGTVDGAMRLLINTNASGGAAITLKHESASSTAANRFRNTTGGDFVLPADGGSAVLTYSSAISRWRIL
jgi:hypothetical protein